MTTPAQHFAAVLHTTGAQADLIGLAALVIAALAMYLPYLLSNLHTPKGN